MALSLVQSKSYGSTASAASHNVVLDAAPTASNLLVLAVVSDTTTSGTPSLWSVANSAIDFTGTYLYYKVAGAGESATISVSLSASDSCVLMAFEYSGNAATPLDKSASAVGQGTVTCGTGTTASTTQADELLFALNGLSNGDNTPPTVTAWSNSFVQQANAASTGSTANIRCVVATRAVLATGTYTTSGTLSGSTSAHNSGIIATFKAATVAATNHFLGLLGCGA